MEQEYTSNKKFSLSYFMLGNLCTPRKVKRYLDDIWSLQKDITRPNLSFSR